MNLFEDFDLEEKTQVNLLGNKRKKDDVYSENPEAIIELIDKKQQIVESVVSQNLDLKIENRLVGLIDDYELLKGSEEIKMMNLEKFEVKGCLHEMYSPRGVEITCKIFLYIII